MGLAASFLVSCSSMKSTMQKVGKSTSSGIAKLDARKWKMPKFPWGKKTQTPPVVAVRSKDLEKIKSGQEKIVAYNRSQKSRRAPKAKLYMPEDFDASSLAAQDLPSSYGILPSLGNKQGRTKKKADQQIGSLPDSALAVPDLSAIPEPVEPGEEVDVPLPEVPPLPDPEPSPEKPAEETEKGE